MKIKLIKINQNFIDFLFVTAFFLCIWLPILHISDEEKSIQENRILTPRPLITNIWNNSRVKYREQFESWFNDHFWLRKKMLSFYENFFNLISLNKYELVLIGKDGWLFYKGDNSIENFRNSILFTEKELQSITSYLNDINKWCKQNGKLFVYFIAPDKNKVYGNYYPSYIKKLRPDTESRANQLLGYLKKHSNIHIIYPLKEIKEEKRLTYYKNDTHWNNLGAYIGYQKLLSVFPNFKDISIQNYELETWEKGDLNNMYKSLPLDKNTLYFKPMFNKNYKCNKIKGLKDNKVCKNSKGHLTAFILRDSFMGSVGRYLSQNFSKVMFFWRYNFNMDDLDLIKKEADIIILEQAERYLPELIKLKFPRDKL